VTEFTPIAGLVGGGLIGISAALLFIFTARTAGISGIVNGLFSSNKTEILWRATFIMGLILGPIITSQFNFNLPASINLTWFQVVIGGILVGVGTNLANGCTSGHGVCGISRFSTRSIIATIVFMLVAILTVWVVRSGLGEIL
jgi:uncharacterized protein